MKAVLAGPIEVVMSHVLISGLLVLAVTVTTATADDEQPPFKITTKRDNDRIEVKAEMNKTIFSVYSPFGISNAAIERTGDKWSDAKVLRLYLKGLENFRATNGNVGMAHRWQRGSDCREGMDRAVVRWRRSVAESRWDRFNMDLVTDLAGMVKPQGDCLSQLLHVE